MEIGLYTLLILLIGSPCSSFLIHLLFSRPTSRGLTSGARNLTTSLDPAANLREVCREKVVTSEFDAASLSSFLIGIGFISSVLLFIKNLGSNSIHFFFFHLTTLNSLLCTLILFVSFIVHRFSIRYMSGDRFYRRYFFILSAMTLSAMSWVLVDNIFLFWMGWSLSNIFLVMLMIHKGEWEAAKQSGYLTLKTLMFGSLCLILAMILLYSVNDSASFEFLTSANQDHSFIVSLSLTLILFTALAQSAVWPFHRWLISSLNSPTPVSALMHAGLVNGGGILIVKFAPLFFVNETLLTVLFLLGAISTVLGNIWKLIQTDIKRMLACSTMSQMGFMIMQCALGLFSAAITHLCWHGLFKAYLFLSSGSAITQAKTGVTGKENHLFSILLSVAGGLLAMYAFALITAKPIFSLEPTTFLLAFAFISGAQINLTLQRRIQSVLKYSFVLPVSFLSGMLYGKSVSLIESILPNLNAAPITTLNSLHLITLVLFIMIWFAFNVGFVNKIKDSNAWARFYMMMLNQSQPHPKTITTIRNTYQF
ncbi:proton-conducting transporter membrane subunit [Legionella yabuuchiae]|uniref:proton-conducting transporter transmembrane domain-containing protein n=1 Tax=Legionella yabuuchiae TaxID=376727 RepID=UPI0013EF9D93|nr:proton-conducting transporter membrane subunit [Legionella yabuuchiae]